jgi:hypothetical protein
MISTTTSRATGGQAVTAIDSGSNPWCTTTEATLAATETTAHQAGSWIFRAVQGHVALA